MGGIQPPDDLAAILQKTHGEDRQEVLMGHKPNHDTDLPTRIRQCHVCAQTWQDHAPQLFVLPHPSWRNTGWLKKNPWFATDLPGQLRARVQQVLEN